MSPDVGHLQDIVAPAKRALSYLEGQNIDGFLRDIKTQDAVLWRLAVIGEASNNMTQGTRDAIALPWPQIIGMRHVAIHHYQKLQMPRVWDTVHEHVPELVAKVEEFLQGIP
ncbi:MAG TPA: HepT-like ribonuclease domain-containing protein [Thermoanaerobaculia bacterium]|nr:HepT-like ribonuclease domain-containing protein [Thermoanaerobaculia bacterium]